MWGRGGERRRGCRCEVDGDVELESDVGDYARLGTGEGQVEPEIPIFFPSTVFFMP